MPQQQNKMAPVRGETTVPRHHNEPLVTSHKNRDSENHRSEFLAKVRKMAKNEIIFSQSEIVSFFIEKEKERKAKRTLENFVQNKIITKKD